MLISAVSVVQVLLEVLDYRYTVQNYHYYNIIRINICCTRPHCSIIVFLLEL